ncbi:MAG: DNA methyltransferase [Bryobacteraceae bacterium]
MTPYYQQDGIEIYHGDCREILPTLPKVDLVLTDPPYPRTDYPWAYIPLESVPLPKVHGFYFWPSNTPFPLPYTAVHVWSKCNVLVGGAEPYENIYEVAGGMFCGVWRHAVINCEMNAVMNGDVYYPHPTQKPIRLLRRMVRKTDGLILDPFMGSGTTLVAAKQLGRRAIGIEIEEKYCEIAVRRLAQEMLPFADPPASRPEQFLINLGAQDAIKEEILQMDGV